MQCFVARWLNHPFFHIFFIYCKYSILKHVVLLISSTMFNNPIFYYIISKFSTGSLKAATVFTAHGKSILILSSYFIRIPNALRFCLLNSDGLLAILLELDSLMLLLL